MNGKRLLSIAGLLILLALVLGWIFSPRVTALQPQGREYHGKQPITITFTRPMDQESVESALSFQPSQEGEFQWNDSSQSLTFTPQDVWTSDTQITVQITGDARSTSHLPLLNPQSWEIKIGPYLLTYLYPADSESNLYSLDVKDGEIHPLTERPNGILDYDISPDGLTIYYSTAHEDGTSGIYALQRPSGETTPLLTCSEALCRNPQISPQGTFIAYQRIPNIPERKPHILLWEIETQTTAPVQEGNHHLEHPLWSPQGWLAYYDRTDNAYTFIHPGQSKTIIIPNETGAQGTWSPDGERFITTEILDLDENLAPRHLFAYLRSDGSKVDLTDDPYLEDANPSYSPQGKYIAFSRKSLLPADWTPGRQLWLREQANNQAYPLTDAVDYHHTAFAWHPDGSQLAYVRYNQAQLAEAPEIWLIDVADTQKVRLVINAFAPQWIP